MPAGKKEKKTSNARTFLEKVGLTKPEPPAPGTLAAANRARGEEIISVLRSVDFAKGAYKGADGRDSVEELSKKTAAMIVALTNNPTIYDDISEMNDLVLYAANAFKNAVADGSEQKALWAKNALCAGILYYRDNVPEDHSEDREKILKARTKYMSIYKTIIQLYEKADAAERRIRDLDRQLDERHQEYDPQVAEIRNLKNSAEGQLLYGRIRQYENEPSMLTEKETEFLKTVRKTASDAHTIFQLLSNRTASQLDYETAMEQAADVRIQLSHKPDVFNEKLSAQHAFLLEEQAKLVAESYAEAAKLVETVRVSDAKLQSIINGRDAQVVMHNLVKTMDDILYENAEDDTEALKAGRRMAQQAAAAEAEYAAAQAAVAEEMKNSVHFNEDAELQMMFGINENTEADEDTDSEDNGNIQYNYET